MPAFIVVGLQWGDEGKGKLIDLIASEANHVVRGQGGNNAGHTVIAREREYKLHLIPSGILYPHVRCYIGGGTVIDPEVLMTEIEGLKSQGISVKNRLFISPYAHVIFPYHRKLDQLYEKGRKFIGTTKKGIGPCYTDKAKRVGIRICELIEPSLLKERLTDFLGLKNEEIVSIFKEMPFSLEEILVQYEALGKELQEYVKPVEKMLHNALAAGEKILLEGAQGTFLDVTFGTYPFVTSSSTIAGGVCAGAGVGPSKIKHVLGVVKAYTTRVGEGFFPTEFDKNEETMFMGAKEAREFGTTTGRKRRMGWLDVPLVRYAVGLNGVDSIAITKLDILDLLKEIKICVGYRRGADFIDYPLAAQEELKQLQPVYETIPGWESSTKECKKWEDLPSQAKVYLDKIEKLCGVPFSFVSIGPEREKTIVLKDIYANH